MMQPPKRSDEIGVVEAAASPGPYRINVAAALSGVPPATLRAWERRYGVPVPRRTTSAYRLYTADDVGLITRMREMVDAGMAPAQAASAVLASGTSMPLADDRGETGALELARDRLLSATQRYDGRALDEELMRLSLLLDAQTFYSKVVSPLLVEVGKRWEDGVLSIAQEHLLSEKLELALRASLRALERVDGPHVLLGALDGDTHVLGLIGAALRFAGSGAKVTLLGATTPPSAISDAVRSMSPRLVGLSATSQPADARALFRAYAKACGSTPWVVGGITAPKLESAVEAAGGSVVAGSANEWGPRVRDWMRGRR